MNIFRKKKKQGNDLDETFIRLIQVANEDKEVKDKLLAILSLEKEKRKFMLNTWLQEMKYKKAPSDFLTSISYFLDDDIAERALKIISGQEKIK
jgi:hypothetical protein